jgi:ppGpp synthetase/RelA/SpoT-type nucleotidyltranferase
MIYIMADRAKSPTYFKDKFQRRGANLIVQEIVF